MGAGVQGQVPSHEGLRWFQRASRAPPLSHAQASMSGTALLHVCDSDGGAGARVYTDYSVRVDVHPRCARAAGAVWY